MTAELASGHALAHDSEVFVVARRLALAAALACAPPLPLAHAQETRADEQRAEREAKQQAVAAPKPNALERMLKAVETSGVPLITRDGVYAKFGTLTTGSGFAMGEAIARGGSSSAMPAWICGRAAP